MVRQCKSPGAYAGIDGEGVSTFFSSSPLSFYFPSLPLEVGSTFNQLGGLEERCKLPQRGPGGAQVENEFGSLYRAVR